MDENKPASPWDELVDVLGVEADASALERRQPKSELPTTRSADSEKPRQAPKSKPGDWSALAGSLGLEITAEEEPTAVDDELPELRSEFDKALVESTGDSELEDEVSGISGEAARSAFDALFADTASEWALPTSAGNVLDTPLEFTEEGAAVEEFDSELAEEAPASERPKRRRGRRRRGRGRGGRDERPAEGGAPRESARRSNVDDDEHDEDDVSVDESAEQESSDDEESREDRPRRRRSRRRGRGRGGKDDRAPVAKTASADRDSEDIEDDDDDDDSAEQQGGLFDLGGDEDDDSDGGESGGQRANHRNLPTWSEALSVIIESNMAQRSKSPSRPSGGGGGGRGRGRGGRGRKRS